MDRARRILHRVIGARPIRRVLLVTPPDASREMFQFQTAKRGRYANYPPYGLGLVAASLREIGIEVKICNLQHEVLRECGRHDAPMSFDYDRTWRERLDDEFADFQPDFIGVSCMFTMTHVSLQRVCSHLSTTGVPIGIGGVHVTNDVERVLDEIPAAGIAFLRESDRAIQIFVKVVNGDLSIDKLGQIILNAQRVDGGRERVRFTRDCMPTEDEIGYIPGYDLLEVSEYSRVGTIGSYYCLKPKETVFATVLSNRGCRAQCTFCSVRNFNGKRVRQRGVLGVVDELQLLVERYGVGHVMWLDDDLLKDHRRAVEMFNEIVRRNLKLTWDASNGVIAASCTDDVVHSAAESGCIGLHIGMESGNAKILREIKKPGTVENFLSAAENLRMCSGSPAEQRSFAAYRWSNLAAPQTARSFKAAAPLKCCEALPPTASPSTPAECSRSARAKSCSARSRRC
jgi:B12 binding domain/Radical SAM superfamily